MQLVRGNDADAEEALGIAESLVLQYKARLDGNLAFFASELALVAYGYAQIGLREDALRLFDEIDSVATDYHVYSGSRAASYLAIGNSEQALYWLNQAADSPVYDYGTEALILIKGNILSDPILDRPEFLEVRSRLGFRE